MTTYTLDGYKVSSDDQGTFTGIEDTTLEIITEDALSTLRYQWFNSGNSTDPEAVFDDTGAIWNIFVDGENYASDDFSDLVAVFRVSGSGFSSVVLEFYNFRTDNTYDFFLDGQDVLGGRSVAQLNAELSSGVSFGRVTSGPFAANTNIPINTVPWSSVTENDDIIGSNNGETINSGVGNDTLTGEGGNDTLDGGAGNDSVEGNTGDDSITGGTGDDVLMGGAGNDTIEGGAGFDAAIFGVASSEITVQALRANTALEVGGEGFDRVTDDVESFVFTDTTLTYAQMLDRVVDPDGPTEGADTLQGTEGADTIDAMGGDDSVTGLGGDDDLRGDTGNDTLEGGDGNDLLNGGAGNNTLYGGVGFDTAYYELRSTWFTSRTVTDGVELTSHLGTDFLSNDIEQVIFADGTFGLDFVIGQGDGTVESTLSNNSDTYVGRGANDVVLALAGNDIITPGLGNDTVDGGEGTDTVSFIDHRAAVIVNLVEGTANSITDRNILIDVENVTGSIYGDFILTDEAVNRVRSGGGYDWMVGSEGADYFDGSNGRDMISYINGTEAVEVDLGAGRGRAGQANGDRYVEIERVTGTIYSDLFYGSDGEDEFRGAGGYDWMVASTGGRDRYDGGVGLDTVSYALAESAVSASLLLGRGISGDASRDLYTSIENLTGSNHDDTLTGDNGRNILRGQYGEDTLFGNGGVDRLTGGALDDYLDGGGSFDYAVYTGNQADYSVTETATGHSVTHLNGGRDGTDTLVNIEALLFADGELML